MNKQTCDAEIKVHDSNPWRWHNCKRRPKWRIQASSGVYLEYCDLHKGHATDPTCMTPATFATLKRI